MNSERGFTLIEIIVVMSIIAVVSTIATLSWRNMVMKSAIETQIKTLHADMMALRLEALYTKRERSITVSGNGFRIYSSTVTSVTPLVTKSYKYNFYPSSLKKVTFDTSGMANGYQGSFCVDPHGDLTVAIDAAVDSLVVSQARINLGKRDEGGNCDSSDIKQK